MIIYKSSKGVGYELCSLSDSTFYLLCLDQPDNGLYGILIIRYNKSHFEKNVKTHILINRVNLHCSGFVKLTCKTQWCFCKAIIAFQNYWNHRTMNTWLIQFIPKTECLPGYHFPGCNIPCRFPNYGDDCQSECLSCTKQNCNHITGCPEISNAYIV